MRAAEGGSLDMVRKRRVLPPRRAESLRGDVSFPSHAGPSPARRRSRRRRHLPEGPDGSACCVSGGPPRAPRPPHRRRGGRERPRQLRVRRLRRRPHAAHVRLSLRLTGGGEGVTCRWRRPACAVGLRVAAAVLRSGGQVCIPMCRPQSPARRHRDALTMSTDSVAMFASHRLRSAWLVTAASACPGARRPSPTRTCQSSAYSSDWIRQKARRNALVSLIVGARQKNRLAV